MLFALRDFSNDHRYFSPVLGLHGKKKEMRALQTIRSVKEGRRCSRHQHRDSPAASEGDHGDRGCPPCSSWRTTSEQTATLQPHCSGAGGSALKKSTAVENPRWRRLLAGAAAHAERSPHGRRLSGRNCGPWGTVLKQSVPKGLHAMERATLE